MTALFAATLFLGAALLFWVQPMIARMVLPLLGGSPSVWNTCMFFFQALLLAGYGYAHLLTTRLRLPWQVAVHGCLLALAGLALPFRIPEALVNSLAADSNPALWLVGALGCVAGLPFFAVSATGPLLQRWFSRTGHGAAGDPYFLYSASNSGSLLALMSYPALFEPGLRLGEQARLWTWGYAALGAVIVICGAVTWRGGRRGGGAAAAVTAAAPGPGQVPATGGPGGGAGRRQGIRWMAFAFVPSSLMLGVTSYLGTDIASIPLLWVVPLSIYLATFILVFARRSSPGSGWFAWLLPVSALGILFQMLTRGSHPVWLVILIHLVFLFLSGMVCHGRLASERPGPEGLTAFYFWMALGGVLGGLFNALLAPLLFNSMLEYPLAVVLACLLRPRRVPERAGGRRLDLALAALLGVFTAGLALMIPFAGIASINLRNAIVIGLPAVICFAFVDRPSRFGLGLAGMVAGGWMIYVPHGRTLHVERNFFGVSRVTLGTAGQYRYFIHGNTLHGEQSLDPARRCEPLAYYHPTGPLGDIFELHRSRQGPERGRVAVIGLGAGATACYARPGEDWTFYEIDPAVVRIARNTNFFSYLSGCAGTEPRIVLGDARLRLRAAPDGFYGLLVVDAFSSDAIPVHLLTREALALYVSKLADGGLLAFHISNRYLDLEPVLSELARDANLACRHRDDWNLTPEEMAEGKEESHWVILARREGDLGLLLRRSAWWRLETRSAPGVWTDDFSNLIGVFKWR